MQAGKIARMGIFASILALFGCDELVKSQIVYSTGTDVGQMLQGAMADGPVLVEAMGETLGTDTATLGERMVRLLRENNPRPWLAFEGDRRKTASEHRIVFIFDARTVRQPDFAAICAGRPPRFEKDSGTLNVHVAICGPRGPAVAVWGWVKRPQSIDDPAFDRLMIQVGQTAILGRT